MQGAAISELKKQQISVNLYTNNELSRIVAAKSVTKTLYVLVKINSAPLTLKSFSEKVS